MKPDIRCFRVLVALSFSEMPAESTWANCADIALLPLLWQILKPTNAIDGIFKLNLECAQASVCLHLSVRPHFSSCWFFLAVKHMIILELLTWFKQILHVFVLDSVPAVIKLIKLKTSADFLGSSLHWKWQEVNGLLADSPQAACQPDTAQSPAELLARLPAPSTAPSPALGGVSPPEEGTQSTTQHL